jgi:hypothetical protein
MIGRIPCRLWHILFQVHVVDIFLLLVFGDLKEEEKNWWINKKLEARMHHGRRFWAWELEPPRSHPMWYNRTENPELFRWGFEGMHDLTAFELVPRPIMANWWCPTPCGTLNLSRKLCKNLDPFARFLLRVSHYGSCICYRPTCCPVLSS